VVPLVISHGAGFEMRRTLGVAVFFGMLGVTGFGIFLTPVFYFVIDWLRIAVRSQRMSEATCLTEYVRHDLDVWCRPCLAATTDCVGRLGERRWVMRAKVEATLRRSAVRFADNVADRVRSAAIVDALAAGEAESAAGDNQITAAIRSLVANAKPEATSLELLNLPQSSELRRELEPVLKAEHYKGFVVVEPTGRIVASYRNELVGVMLPDQTTVAAESQGVCR